jgi:putative ABC transport system permease protein
VQAITTGFAPVGSRASKLAALAKRLSLPISIGVGIKDSFARPRRALFTIGALSLTVVTLTFTLGMEATFARVVDDRGLVEEPWDIELRRSGSDAASIGAVLDANAGVASYATSTWLEGSLASSEGGRPRFELRALGGDVEHAGYPLVEGRVFSAPGEAMIGRTLAEELGLSVGDTIEVAASNASFDRPASATIELTITGIYVEPEEDGQVILFPMESAVAAFPDLEIDTYEVMMKSGADWDALIREVQAATNYGVDIDLSERGMPSEASTIRGILIGLSVLLLVIGIANMLNTTMLNVRERARDLGVLKSLGMTPKQVVQSVASGVTLLTMGATAVGIPVGLLVYKGLFTLIAEKMADADPQLYTPPAWGGLALIVPGALLFALVASVLPARKAVTVPVTEVLRSE